MLPKRFFEFIDVMTSFQTLLPKYYTGHIAYHNNTKNDADPTERKANTMRWTSMYPRLNEGSESFALFKRVLLGVNRT